MVMQAFEYVYKNHLDEADWFLKADDDTFTIVENLRFLLKDKNSSEPMFFVPKVCFVLFIFLRHRQLRDILVVGLAMFFLRKL